VTDRPLVRIRITRDKKISLFTHLIEVESALSTHVDCMLLLFQVTFFNRSTMSAALRQLKIYFLRPEKSRICFFHLEESDSGKKHKITLI